MSAILHYSVLLIVILHSFILISVILLSAILNSSVDMSVILHGFVLLSIILLCIVAQNVILLNVLAPSYNPQNNTDSATFSFFQCSNHFVNSAPLKVKFHYNFLSKKREAPCFGHSPYSSL
jgi:hypothetical protein